MYDFSFLPRPLDALIVVPPFAQVRIASLAAHLLQSCARRAGFRVSVLYAGMTFAAEAGHADYEVLCETKPDLLGERLFAAAAYGLQALGAGGEPLAAGITGMRPDAAGLPRLSLERLKDLESLARAWVERIVAAIAPLDCPVVGFTSSYHQTSASVALARALRERRPDVVTLIGGANCRGVLADGVASIGREPDFVVRGEGESAFVSLLEKLRGGGRPDGRVVDGAPCASLDDLPIPDYGDFFTQAGLYLPRLDPRTLILPYDCARGCWWGDRHPCAFCSEVPPVAFREKAAHVFLREIRALATAYPARWVYLTASVVPRSYSDTVVPCLARRPTGLSLIWTSRVPLTMREAVDLRGAGVAAVTLGVESFSTRLLRSIGKGTTTADNVAALRHCRIAGLLPSYNLLFGLPGDRIEDYHRMAALMPLLRHLQPPDGMVRIEINRNSPYFETPVRYGLANLRPAPAYFSAFPPTANLELLADLCEADFESESIERDDALAGCRDEIRAWQSAWSGPAASWPRLSIRRCPGAIGRLGEGLFGLTDTRGMPGCAAASLVSRSQARAALATSDAASPGGRFALERKLAVVLDGRYVPLATADPLLVSEFEAEQSH